VVTTLDNLEAVVAALEAADVRLSLRGVRLVIDAPQGVVTPDLAKAMRTHKAALVHAVRVAGPCGNCGSTRFIDTPIHEGRSVRRDCGDCGRTWGFPVWSPICNDLTRT